ncbi:Uncharacterized protein FWK35_00004607, partial [Aphis craccivora]
MAFFPLLPYRSAVTSHTVIPHLLAAVWCVAVSTIIGYLHLHPIESYKASQTDDNSEDVPTINKCENRLIDKVQTDVNNSGDNLTVNKPKIQPTCEVRKLWDYYKFELNFDISKMVVINDQLLREKKMKEIAGCQLLLGIHKARLNIKRENAL